MMRSLTVREASMAEIPIIRELAERAWWPAYKDILAEEQIRYMLNVLYSPQALREQMESGHRFLLLPGNEDPSDRAALADREQAFLGFASWSPVPGTATARLHKIYVVPEAQGKGAGKALVEAVESRARGDSCVQLELNVNRFNKARGFYEKLGFRVGRTVDIPIGPYFMNDYIMLKAL